MQISIQEIEPEEVIEEINSSDAKEIIGGISQFASISASGTISGGYAGLSIRSRSFGGNPFLEFGGSFNLVETSKGVSSSTSAFVRSGNS